VLLIARAVLDLVFSVGRVGRPSGAALRLVEVVYRATDPALGLVRRYIPPLRLGNTAFDLGFLLMFIVIVVLRSVVSTF
jgi:YggT family protein